MLFHILNPPGGKMWEASWNEVTKASPKPSDRPGETWDGMSPGWGLEASHKWTSAMVWLHVQLRSFFPPTTKWPRKDELKKNNSLRYLKSKTPAHCSRWRLRFLLVFLLLKWSYISCLLPTRDPQSHYIFALSCLPQYIFSPLSILKWSWLY